MTGDKTNKWCRDFFKREWKYSVICTLIILIISLLVLVVYIWIIIYNKALYDLLRSYCTYSTYKRVAFFFLGFYISLWLGHLFVDLMHNYLRRKIWEAFGYKDFTFASNGIPPCFTGFIERTFFTIISVIAFQNGRAYSGLFTLIGAWLALKLAANWQRQGNNLRRVLIPHLSTFENKTTISLPSEMMAVFTLSAILLGIASLSFALLGGFIIKLGL